MKENQCMDYDIDISLLIQNKLFVHEPQVLPIFNLSCILFLKVFRDWGFYSYFYGEPKAGFFLKNWSIMV